MEHKFVNYGRISLIVSYLERYNVGLLESGIILRNIHEFSTQEAMSPGTLFLHFSSHSMSKRGDMG
jgi:hypothetical protein